MKVMLVDDDFPVLKFISRVVPWEKLSLNLHSMHNNGRSAYEAALEQMPDMVLTDIGMPEMDGIELISKLKEQKPNLQVAILTCHSEFQYAQQALKLNVQDYLLKDTLKPDDIVQLLHRLKESLDQEERVKERENQLRRIADRGREVMKERFIRRTIEQPIISPEQWWQEAETFGVVRGRAAYVPVILSIDDYLLASKRFVSEETLRYAVDNVLSEVVSALPGSPVFFPYVKHQSFILFGFQDRIKQNIFEQIAVQLKIIQDQLRQALRLSVTILYGEACLNEEELKERLSELQAGYDQRFYSQKGSLMALCELTYDETDLFSRYDEVSQTFRDRFIASDVKGLTDIVEQWSQQLERNPQPSELVKNWVFKLLLDLRLKFQSMQFFWSQASVDLMQFEIFGLNSIFELKSWLFDQAERVVTNTSHIVRMADRSELALARQYILQHLDKKIGLEEVAEHLNLNSSYFSRLFSQKLGETFTEFVTRMKMERAKELLDQTNHSIGTICVMLGYESQGYFIKRFKACFGMTPVEYKGRKIKNG